MKNILFVTLCSLVLAVPCLAATDTLEGEELTSSANIEGVTTTDTVDGQVLTAGGGGGTEVSDDFNRSDGALGSNWTTAPGGGDIVIASNEVQGGGSSHRLVYWSADTFDNDQYAQLEIANVGGSTPDMGPAVRVGSGGATMNCYFLSVKQSLVRIYKIISGSATQLGADYTGDTAIVGDVYRLEVSGTTLSIKKNGSPYGTTRTDSDLSSGYAGMWCYSNTGLCDDWAGGDL